MTNPMDEWLEKALADQKAAEKCCITEDGKCDALRDVARSLAGHIRKPYSAGEIAAIIESGDYSSEMMMHHLLILVTNA